MVATVTGEAPSGSVSPLIILLFIIAVNFLIESLQRFWMYYRNDFQIECPTGSGNQMTPLGKDPPYLHLFDP